MNYLEIQAFLAIVRFGSVTKAAQSLFVSQSTLSQRLKALETKLEVVLMVRNKGRDYITLTPSGERFLHVALKMEELMIEANDLKTTQDENTITIGAVDSVHNFVLYPLYHEIRKRYPKTKLILKTHQSNEIYSLLERREIDIGFPLQERVLRNYDVTKFFKEKMVMIKRRGVSRRGKVHNSELNTELELYVNWGAPFRTWHEKWWGIEGTRGTQVDTGSLLLRFMSHPENWAIVPVSMAKGFQEIEEIDICPLLEEPPTRTCYIAYIKNSDRKSFIDECFLEKKSLIKSIME